MKNIIIVAIFLLFSPFLYCTSEFVLEETTYCTSELVLEETDFQKKINEIFQKKVEEFEKQSKEWFETPWIRMALLTPIKERINDIEEGKSVDEKDPTLDFNFERYEPKLLTTCELEERANILNSKVIPAYEKYVVETIHQIVHQFSLDSYLEQTPKIDPLSLKDGGYFKLHEKKLHQAFQKRIEELQSKNTPRNFRRPCSIQ